MKRKQYTPSQESIAKIKRIFANALFEKAQGLSRSEAEEKIDPALADKIRSSQRPCFHYQMSRYCRYTTIILFVIIAVIATLLLLTSSGTYLSAWFTSIALAILLLFVISFPRKLIITDTDLEIHSILEVTKIPLIDIIRVQPIDRYRLKRHFLVLGSYGFGGFFGYYVDFIHLRLVRMSATELTNLILLQTLFGQRYIINCRYRDLFIELLKQRISLARGNQEVPLQEHLEGDEDEEDEEE